MNHKFKVVAAACIVQYIILNVHTVCDVIITRRCGLWKVAVICGLILLPALECVMELWTRLCLKAVMYISLRLGSDLEIRIQRKLCSDTDTTTLFFVFQSQLTKLSAIHRWKLKQRCWFQHLGWRWQLRFLAIPAGTAAFVCAASLV